MKVKDIELEAIAKLKRVAEMTDIGVGKIKVRTEMRVNGLKDLNTTEGLKYVDD